MATFITAYLHKLLLLRFIPLAFVFCTATPSLQGQTFLAPVRTVNDESLGERGQREISIYTDRNNNIVTEIRLRNIYGMFGSVIWTKGADGRYTCEQTGYNKDGITCISVIKFDENRKILSKQTTNYSQYPKVQLRYESKRQPDGSLKGGEPYEPITSPETLENIEKEYQKEIEEIEKMNPDPVSFNFTPCDPKTRNCVSKAEVFAGYSYLSGDFGNDKEGLSGGHITAIYNLGPHVGVGINTSLHSKKNGDQKLSRNLIMIEGRYVFQDMEDCDKNFLADIHVLVGLGSERFKYGNGNQSFTTKGSGPAYGAGLSGVIQITNKTSVKAEADYIGIKFKNTDGVNNNFRGSIGVAFKFY